MSAVGGARAGHSSAGVASAAAAATGGAPSRTGDAAGAGAGAAMAPAMSVAEKEAERTVDVRSILKKKEEEVKEMLSPEKEMYGERFVGMEDEVQPGSRLLFLLLAGWAKDEVSMRAAL